MYVMPRISDRLRNLHTDSDKRLHALFRSAQQILVESDASITGENGDAGGPAILLSARDLNDTHLEPAELLSFSNLVAGLLGPSDASYEHGC